jgi:Spy/CpxP family protein refolding chaperone
MKRSRWAALLVGAAVLCGAALTASALGPPAEGEPRKPRKVRKQKPPRDKAARQKKAKGLKGEYAIMVKILEMDEDQQAKLKQAVADRRAALAAWQKGPNGAKYQDLRKAYAEARKAGKKDELKQLREQMKSLQQERARLMAEQSAKIQALLTPEQKLKWSGFTLYRDCMRRYKRLNPKEDQTKLVREMCAAAAKELGDKSDRKARGAAMRKLQKDIEEKVLDDAQREELKKKPVRKPREKKPAGPKERKARAGKPKRD